MARSFLIRGISLWLACSLSFFVLAQDEVPKKDKREVFTVNGYVKDLISGNYNAIEGESLYDNLIHNRLNFRIYPDSSLTIGIELRNRLFLGDSPTVIPSFGRILSIDEGLIDMTWEASTGENHVWISQIDRAWVDYSGKNWELRVGRQRVNWGMNLFWNTNDLFNAYSLADFDYEERPGVDAIRFQYHLADFSSFDLVFKPGRNSLERIAAIRYQFNKSLYDFQVLGGSYGNDMVLGLGWAGSIGMAGFKGELSYFQPVLESDPGPSVLGASISFDYVFGNQLFLTGGYYFFSDGINRPIGNIFNQFLFPPSAKRLLNSMHNLLISTAYPITPLFNANFVTVYSPGFNSLLLMPSLGYSIATNLDLSFFYQGFWLQQDHFQNIGNGLYLRVKFSF